MAVNIIRKMTAKSSEEFGMTAVEISFPNKPGGGEEEMRGAGNSSH